MNDLQLFFMDDNLRALRIKEQQFYISQAHARLLSQFENIGDEATAAGDEWMSRIGAWFDPEWHDAAGFYEQAYEIEIDQYLMLTNLQNQTRLSVVSGFFHEWEKRVREWLVAEVRRWCRDSAAASTIWRKPISEVLELLVGCRLVNPETGYFKKLDACRLVVNVYKHGEGSSLVSLMKLYPEYLGRELYSGSELDPSLPYGMYHYLNLDDDQVHEFSDAVVAFWEGLPDRRYNSEVERWPEWFVKACPATFGRIPIGGKHDE